jgi:hypothetical protein
VFEPTRKKDITHMIRRLILAAILALPTVGVTNLAIAGAPMPGCYPCPPQPPDSPSVNGEAVILQADAR